MNAEPLRLMVLTSSTGTGHNMRAGALAEWMHRLYPGRVEVKIHQVLEETHPLYALGVEFYNLIMRRVPWFHHVYFHILEKLGLHRSPDSILNREAFMEVVRSYRPQMLVSVHAHTNHGFFGLARKALSDAPPWCVTYCGELSGGYGFSRWWVNPRADLWIGATRESCTRAEELGMAAERIHRGGFLLRPSFFLDAEALDAAAGDLRREWDLQPGLPVVVLSTGLAGANNHRGILLALRRLGVRAQVIALCGRNESLRTELAREFPNIAPLAVRPVGYEARMNAVFRLADVMVARPGSGATSEALLMKCALVFNGVGGIMPQESLNVRYARDRVPVRVARTVSGVARAVQDILDGTGRSPSDGSSARKAVPPCHPSVLCEMLHQMMQRPPA